MRDVESNKNEVKISWWKKKMYMNVLLPIVVTLPVFQLEMSPLKAVAPLNTVNEKRFGIVYYQISSIKTIRHRD